MKEICSFLSGVIYLIGYGPYICYVIRGKKAKPLWAPWLIFSTVETIVLCEMRAAKADNSLIWGSMVGSWLTLITTVIYGYSDFKKVDLICLAGAFAGLVVWQTRGQLILGLMISLGAIAIGMIPIIISVYKNPEHEDKRGWTLFWLSCVLATVAIPKWDLANAAQPISFLIAETTVVTLLWFPRRKPAVSSN